MLVLSVIISCVRSNDNRNIGFLSDVKRMNVALTRARFGLFVVGAADTLMCNRHWGSLIVHAQDTDSLVDVVNSAANLRTTIESFNISNRKQSLYNDALQNMNKKKRNDNNGNGNGDDSNLLSGNSVKKTKILTTGNLEEGEEY